MAKTGHRLTGAINSSQELITDREPRNKATVEAPERLFFFFFSLCSTIVLPDEKDVREGNQILE